MLKITAIGNLGNDAKVENVNGRNVINFSIAHSEKYKNNEGVEVEKTVWLSCGIWREQGQSIKVAEYLTKGTKVYIEGLPSVRTYTNSEGVTVASLSVNIRAIELLSSTNKEKTVASATETPAEIQKVVDDLPF